MKFTVELDLNGELNSLSVQNSERKTEIVTSEMLPKATRSYKRAISKKKWKQYSKQEEAFIRKNFSSMSANDIASHLGRTRHGVVFKIGALGLRR